MAPDHRVFRRLPGLLFLLSLYAVLTGLSDRSLGAFFLAGGIAALLHGVSCAKERVLFEPLVPADAALLGQALRHPALYVAYVGYGRFAALALLAAAATLLVLSAEAPRGMGAGTRLALIGMPFLSFALTRRFLVPRCPLTLDAAADRARYGLLSMLGLYMSAPRAPLPPCRPFAVPPADAGAPHLVLVQAESFYDPRLFWPEPYRSLARERLQLPVWDRLCAEGMTGALRVPARGANTMRTEFAVLGARDESSLGFHRFNPLLSVRGGPVPTPVADLARAGYRTIGIHPHDGRFFRRAACYPLMGFGQFVDEAGFTDAPRRGPYIADEALGGRIAALLEDAPVPCFIFAVTMENHGPWREGRYDPATRGRIGAAFPGLPFALAAYCYHLQGTDALLGRLAALSGGGRRVAVGLYGDHPPSFPGLWDQPPEPRTSFLVWPQGGGAGAAVAEMPQASDFMGIFLERAGAGRGDGAGQAGTR